MSAILAETRTIALVGASSDPAKPSNRVMKGLLDAGFHVIPVSPREGEVHGQRAYPSLGEVPERIDIVGVFRPAQVTRPIAEEAVAIGAKVFWLQIDIVDDAAAHVARAAGPTVVMDRYLWQVARTMPAT